MSFQGQEFTKLFHLSFCVISLSCFCLPHVQIFQIFMQELSTLVTSTECLLWGEHAVVTGCKLAICNEQWNQLTTHNLTFSLAIFQFHHWGLLLNQNHDRNLRQRRSVTDLGDDCCSDLWARSRWTQHHRFGECPRRQPPGRSGMFSWCSWCWDWKPIWFKSSNFLWRLWNYRLLSSRNLPKLLPFWRFWSLWTSRLSPCCHGTRQERFLHWHDMVVSTAVGLMSPEHVTVAVWFTRCHVADTCWYTASDFRFHPKLDWKSCFWMDLSLLGGREGDSCSRDARHQKASDRLTFWTQLGIMEHFPRRGATWLL